MWIEKLGVKLSISLQNFLMGNKNQLCSYWCIYSLILYTISSELMVNFVLHLLSLMNLCLGKFCLTLTSTSVGITYLSLMVIELLRSLDLIVCWIKIFRPSSWRHVPLASNNYGPSWQSLCRRSVSCQHSFPSRLSV